MKKFFIGKLYGKYMKVNLIFKNHLNYSLIKSYKYFGSYFNLNFHI